MIEETTNTQETQEPNSDGEYLKDGQEEELFEDIDDCSGCPETVTKVRIDLQKWYEIQHIKELQKGQEFAIYLLGSFSPTDGNPEIDDYYIPEQEVTSVNADIVEEDIPPNVASRIIGHLHSHHSMGCTPSGTDNHHRNWPVHIIISDKGNSAIVHKKTTCGRMIKAEAEIEIQFDVSGIQGLEKIKERTYSWQQPKNLCCNYDNKHKRFKLRDVRVNRDDELSEEELQEIGYEIGRFYRPGMY